MDSSEKYTPAFKELEWSKKTFGFPAYIDMNWDNYTTNGLYSDVKLEQNVGKQRSYADVVKGVG